MALEKKQIFIIGSGRSGTTLVQRLFNSFPNTMIWGEHSGFLTSISDAYYTLMRNPSMHEYSYSQVAPATTDNLIEFYKRPERWQAWNNWFQPNDVKELFKQYLESIFNPKGIGESVIWGFKEIRYGKNDRVIDFLAELYPKAQFVFITRNGLNTLESQLTTFHQGESKYLAIKRILQLPIAIRIAINWTTQNRYLMRLAASDNGNFQLIQFEHIIKDINILEPILSKLGLSIGEKQLEVMKMKEGRGTGFKGTDVDLRWKRLGFFPGFIAEMILGATNSKIGYQTPKRLIPANYISRLVNRLMEFSSAKKD